MKLQSRLDWLRLMLLSCCFALAQPALAGFTQRQKITSVPRGTGAQFGNAVAISGNTMVVGARFDATTAAQAGAAFVFVLSGSTWTQQAKLLASDGASADKFGSSVAIAGDTLVIGAYNDDAAFADSGSAYVFVRNGTTWTQQQKLTASDGTLGDEFGNAVAVLGDTAVVGAHFADLPLNSAAGSVYLYRRSGTVWTQTQKFIPVGGVVLGDSFGESLAMSADKLAIGSSTADIPQTAAGSVYVFAESGGSYFQQQRLSIGSGTNGDLFGHSVAIEGNTLVGGAREDTPAVGLQSAGAAYVFEFNGTTWSEQQKLTASDGASFDRFGWSVGISNNVVVVGAREDDSPTAGGDTGSAYVFTRSGATWTQQQKISPADSVNGDRFGVSLALSSGLLVVGAAEKALTSPNGQGAAYVFSSHPFVFPDFDGDGKADLSYVHPADGNWWVKRSSDGSTYATPWGFGTDLIAAGDYDGDGKTDQAVFRSGNWFVLQSSNGQTVTFTFGTAGDLPIPGDFDADGLADRSVFRPSSGEWLRINSSNAQAVTVASGANGDIPLIGDFDGDGRSDVSWYRPSTGDWATTRSSDGVFSSVPFGIAGDSPAPADYDGDGKTDMALYRPASGTWFVNRSSSGLTIVSFGVSGDKPVAADYDGDGSADVGVFRPGSGTWFVQRSTLGILIEPFGAVSDRPIPLYFTRQGAVGAGRVPGDLGSESALIAEKIGASLRLTWAGTCVSSDTDFAVYQGVLGSFTSHLPEVCSTGGSMSATFAPASGNRYYLVVSHNGTNDGSYGYTRSGAERAVSGSACHPQSIGSCP